MTFEMDYIVSSITDFSPGLKVNVCCGTLVTKLGPQGAALKLGSIAGGLIIVNNQIVLRHRGASRVFSIVALCVRREWTSLKSFCIFFKLVI